MHTAAWYGEAHCPLDPSRHPRHRVMPLMPHMALSSTPQVEMVQHLVDSRADVCPPPSLTPEPMSPLSSASYVAPFLGLSLSLTFLVL